MMMNLSMQSLGLFFFFFVWGKLFIIKTIYCCKFYLFGYCGIFITTKLIVSCGNNNIY